MMPKNGSQNLGLISIEEAKMYEFFSVYSVEILSIFVLQNRHPDLPRRPLSTYMIFYLKKKDKVLQENPGLEMVSAF